MKRDPRSHPALLEAIARRMALGAALVRSWSAVLTATLLWVASHPPWTRFGWLALALVIGFWLLDTHLSRQRLLYVALAARAPAANEPPTLATDPVESEHNAFASVFFRAPRLAFHGALALIVVVALWYASPGAAQPAPSFDTNASS